MDLAVFMMPVHCSAPALCRWCHKCVWPFTHSHWWWYEYIWADTRIHTNPQLFFYFSFMMIMNTGDSV